MGYEKTKRGATRKTKLRVHRSRAFRMKRYKKTPARLQSELIGKTPDKPDIKASLASSKGKAEAVLGLRKKAVETRRRNRAVSRYDASKVPETARDSAGEKLGRTNDGAEPTEKVQASIANKPGMAKAKTFRLKRIPNDAGRLPAGSARMIGKKAGVPISKAKPDDSYEAKKKAVERNRRRRSVSRSIKKALRPDGNSENERKSDGNEGVELAAKAGAALKENAVMPLTIRTPAASSRLRHDYKERNLQERRLGYKADAAKALKSAEYSSNPMSRQLQKSRIKRAMLKKYRLKPGGGSILIDGGRAFSSAASQLGGENHSLINAAAAGVLLQVLLVIGALFAAMAILAVAASSMFSIFFSLWQGDPYIEITKMTTEFTSQVTSLIIEMSELDGSSAYPYHLPYDRLVARTEVDTSGQHDYMMQIKLISFLSAFYQDELDERKGMDEIARIVKELYRVETRYQNEPYETQAAVYATDEDGVETLDHYETVEHDFYVLYLTLKEGDFDSYISERLEAIEDPDRKELALIQMDFYQESYGLGQYLENPFGLENEVDWRERISSVVGYRVFDGVNRNMHRGLDMAYPIGTPVYAVASGTVHGIDLNPNSPGGLTVKIKAQDPSDNNDIIITYCHLDSIDVTAGADVSAGDRIGESGNTGSDTTGAHLHLAAEKRLMGIPYLLNPLFIMRFPE
ncbi:MAG: M23 family metallopeptidase [Clostridiales bacterium]|nr:M23 family metallopeptidase [Clostridiales bacterium]